MSSYAIERGVPIPPRTGGGRRTALFPFLLEMSKGDSVLISDPAVTMRQVANRLYQLKVTRGLSFSQRRCEDGIRVWRVA
jgi:hypothetical protein